MPRYNFTNQDNKSFEVLEGDFVVEIIGCEFGVTKDRGDDKMELQWKVEGRDCGGYETLTFTERAAWKIDTFVKSANLLIDGKPPGLNQNIDFNEPMVVGLRAWATLFIDEYQGKKRSKIRVWLTNKPKLEKRKIETESEDPNWEN